MYRLKYLSIVVFLLFVTNLYSQDYSYKFRVHFTDKKDTQYDLNNPQEFLSQRSIDRRLNQNIPLDSLDIPVSEQYISDIEVLGCSVVAKSKWLNTVSVHSDDASIESSLRQLSFVKDVTLVWRGASGTKLSKTSLLKSNPIKKKDYIESDYGTAYKQISINNGQVLHNLGYRGDGMHIAVIDAGFTNFQTLDWLKDINLLGYKDFVYGHAPNDIFSSSDHGTRVLSCMALDQADKMIGTAPEASYWLLRSEDVRSEYPIEEDYWVAAAEFADSAGVDIINTSLGYTTFDVPVQDFTYSDMDGKTTFITKGAEIAASRGMFMVVAAGNERNKSWLKISAPADAESVLTVGAVDSDSVYTFFSSQGPSYDNRVKPDVVSMGQSTITLDIDGKLVPSNGTSFASPVMCGMIACLWQAFPNLTNMQLLDLVKRSAHKYTNPDSDYGYGLANMAEAVKIIEGETGISTIKLTRESSFNVFWSTSSFINIEEKESTGKPYSVIVFSPMGQIVASETFSGNGTVKINGSGNIYFLNITGQNVNETIKVIR